MQVQQWWSWSWSSHVLVVKSASPKVSREQQDWEEQKSANQDCIFRRCPLCYLPSTFFCSSFQLLLLLLPSRLRQSAEKELPEKRYIESGEIETTKTADRPLYTPSRRSSSSSVPGPGSSSSSAQVSVLLLTWLLTTLCFLRVLKRKGILGCCRINGSTEQ